MRAGSGGNRAVRRDRAGQTTPRRIPLVDIMWGQAQWIAHGAWPARCVFRADAVRGAVRSAVVRCPDCKADPPQPPKQKLPNTPSSPRSPISARFPDFPGVSWAPTPALTARRRRFSGEGGRQHRREGGGQAEETGKLGSNGAVFHRRWQCAFIHRLKGGGLGSAPQHKHFARHELNGGVHRLLVKTLRSVTCDRHT